MPLRARHLCFTILSGIVLLLGITTVHAQTGAGESILPTPTGSFAIGRVSYHWVDSARAERLGPDTTARREVIVDVWYPAAGSPRQQRASYLPQIDMLRRVFPDSALRRRYAPAYDAVEDSTLQTRAVEKAPARCPRQACPVLVFSHGLGADRAFYTAQYEDLASHGYVVAVVAHPYLTHTLVFPDVRVVRMAPAPRDRSVPDPSVPVWQRQLAAQRAITALVADIAAADIRFVLDQLTRYARDTSLQAPFVRLLDLDRIGALGHSMGGMAAARACQTDGRFKACLNQDGSTAWLPFSRDADGGTMLQPFLYFTREAPPPKPDADSVLAAKQMTRAQEDSVNRAGPAEQTALLQDLPAGAWRVRLRSPDVTHMSFSDVRLIRSFADSAARRKAVSATALIREFTRAFFDKTLRGRSQTILDSPGRDSTEVSVESFRPGD